MGLRGGYGGCFLDNCDNIFNLPKRFGTSNMINDGSNGWEDIRSNCTPTEIKESDKHVYKRKTAWSD